MLIIRVLNSEYRNLPCTYFSNQIFIRIMITSGQEHILGCFVLNFIRSNLSENNIRKIKEKTARKLNNIII